MRHFSAFLSRLLPMQVLLSTLLVITLFFASALPTMAASSSPDKGEVQLDNIIGKSEAVANSSPTSINPIDKPVEEGPNEVQGNADSDKMLRSNDTELPVVKQVKKAIKQQ